MQRQRSLRDILSGLIFIGIAAAFGYAAYGYDIGTAFQMGPGYFPLVLAGMLALLGIAIVVKGFTATEAEGSLGAIPVRGLLLLLGAIVFFGAAMRGLGLLPTLFLALFASALASTHNSLLSAGALAVGLTAFCILIFIFALGVPLALFGPWLPF